MQKTWFVTGASRGLGAEIARAAMRAGDRVIATSRKRAAVEERPRPEQKAPLLAAHQERKIACMQSPVSRAK
jgi:NAD(P)-dependent dehydrogenase (short-subunit alcohol dehydrogenase family)